jgi:8-oxo-dGTP pyrophosphatase MutT (NUDIX family)
VSRKIAAGCLVRAEFDGEPRYLVVHPSGPYNRGKPYSIPKGLVEPGELPEQAAIRETREETGLDCLIVAPLGEIDYVKSRKTVIAYLAEPLAPPPSPTLSPA